MTKQAACKVDPQLRRHSKVYDVPIPKMRVPAVDVVQRRFNKKQAESYAADFDFQKMGLPIVNLSTGIFWIVDGQHRIAALKMIGLGDGLLSCEVYENLTDAEMALVFLGRDDRRRIDNFTKFQIACTAELPRETEVRRVVEANGLRISRTREEGSIGAVTSLLRVHDAANSQVLGQVLRTIRDAYVSDPQAFDGVVIEGLSFVFNRFNGRTNEKHFVERLSHVQQGVRGLMRRAEQQAQKTGNQKAQCVAAAAVEIYNKGARAADRLPVWWRKDETNG